MCVLHNWSSWNEPEERRIVHYTGDTKTYAKFQSRVCKGCGWVEERQVTDPYVQDPVA